MKPAKCHHPIFTQPTMVTHVLDLVPTNEFDSLFQRDPVPVFEEEFGKLAPVVQKALKAKKALNVVATADTIEAPIVARKTIRAELDTTQLDPTDRQRSSLPSLPRSPSEVLVVDPIQTDPFVADPFVASSEPVMDPAEPFRPIMAPPPQKRRVWSIAMDLVGRPRWPIVLGSFGAVLIGAIGAIALL